MFIFRSEVKAIKVSDCLPVQAPGVPLLLLYQDDQEVRWDLTDELSRSVCDWEAIIIGLEGIEDLTHQGDANECLWLRCHYDFCHQRQVDTGDLTFEIRYLL